MPLSRSQRLFLESAACALLLTPAFARPLPDAWQSAVDARARLESQPSHTRADFARVLDAFRTIYHGNPASPHAAEAVEQVAQLLAEQGRELHDDKSLLAAAGQYDFLLQQYPQSTAARQSRRAASEIRAEMTPPPPAVTKPATTRTVSKPAATRPAPSEPEAAAPQPTAEPEAPATTAKLVSTRPTARVTAIRHWSTSTYTRVAIDLGDDVQYEAARVEHPTRLFFDLHHARLAPELVGKSFSVTDDGFLTRIRAAQYTDDITRVVLDVHDVTEYSAFLLPNPSRLIIDIHGKPAGQGTPLDSASPPPAGQPITQPAAPAPAEEHHADAGPGAASSLPAMPVTDGSAGFGLPSRASSAKVSGTTAVAPPRVVIPVKPTVARPVPNTVTSRSSTTGSEVAAVSEQPGKVEATTRPTSAPIADTTDVRPARSSKSRRSSEPAAPIEAAAPLADGSTSLSRALGLKIGRIVIDAGHGGKDSGTLGPGGLEEKNIVLDVALRLGKMLHQRLGAEIVYTRADDTFIPLETRTAIANKAQADLFISIHANSSPEPSARGVEVYYLNFTSDPEAMRVAARENAVSTQSVHDLSELVKKITLKDKIAESRDLAADVDQGLYGGLTKSADGLTRSNETLRNRGVKKAPFVVLIGANMPSILAEISFITNPTDAAQLRSADYRQRIAESLFTGVSRYATSLNGSHPATPQRSRK